MFHDLHYICSGLVGTSVKAIATVASPGMRSRSIGRRRAGTTGTGTRTRALGPKGCSASDPNAQASWHVRLRAAHKAYSLSPLPSERSQHALLEFVGMKRK